ncbi:hypothetical protein [Actinoplanes couchii]|uniref:hypothetical protein n=1 Tax=Actinoplanes couchii TaxID=403638 RepID=UPI00194134FA|nr:hypothetical protein [Actinoplanes couchii]MDR6324130.1 hypothetical protein [Actinoplanes couchii]
MGVLLGFPAIRDTTDVVVGYHKSAHPCVYLLRKRFDELCLGGLSNTRIAACPIKLTNRVIGAGKWLKHHF